MTRVAAEAVVTRTHRYLGTGSVVGSEGPFLSLVAGEMDDAGLPVTRGDGLLDLGGGRGPVLSAHADRHGLVSRDDRRFGYAAHDVREPGATPGHPSRPFLERVCGRLFDEDVFAYDPVTGEVLGRSMVPHVCQLDGPLTVALEGLSDLPAGTPIAFAHGCELVQETVTGQLDNALGVALAVELLLSGAVGRVLVTTGEEVGSSADRVVRHLCDESPRLLVVDTSPFDDVSVAATGGVVLRHADAGAPFDPATTALVARAAAAVGVRVVFKDAWIEQENRRREQAGEQPAGLGRTELGRIIEATEGRLTGTTVQVPTFDYHTNHESTTLAAITGFVRVFEALAKA